MSEARSPSVVVAMSGGVDSSVAAALLVQQGYRVTGMMLRLWSEPDQEAFNRCCTPASMALARRVAASLEIPFYALDVRREFRETVVQTFLDGYQAGVTPNPCLTCNQRIRWGTLFEHAGAFGADYLATGHYARVAVSGSGDFRLMKAADPEKDQSYVLSVLDQERLSRTLFPIGAYTKKQVRDLAREFSLPVAERSDSQDLCFLAGQDYRSFLRRHAPSVESPGPIIDNEGAALGSHDGLAFYTIGQRKGLGVSGPVPLYVIDKDMERNALIVGPREATGRQTFEAVGVSWVAGAPPGERFRAQVQIRYRSREKPAEIQVRGEDRVVVRLEAPIGGITPGQAAVFYDDEVCLGGGRIDRTIS